MRASSGRRVFLIDADRQGSAAFWTQFRSESDLLQIEVQALQGEAFRRFVSVPRVLYADCAVVPIRPTGVDMYTMQLMDFRVAEARETNPGFRAVALIN